jgi:hypothetical protein
MAFEKPQPGKQSDRVYNPETGLEDNTHGDHSFKNFVKMEWDWCLIWLAFFVISVLQLCNLPTVIGFITDAMQADGLPAAIMVTMGMLIWIPTLIGMTAFLWDWWMKLCGRKSWNKRILDKK